MRTPPQTGAVTLIQCFGSALNLNIHFHMLFLDGVYSANDTGLRFRRTSAPTKDELNHLTHIITHRVARCLEREGLLVRDAGNTYLTGNGVDEDPESPLNHLLGSSITYRIALGPQQGRKVFTLQTLPNLQSDELAEVGETAGFSLHAGVATEANDRSKLERLCRYITRPLVSTKRLSLTRNGRVSYQLKTPWRNGTTHVIFEPLNFISRLASLVPRPRINLTRFHGVFAPNSQYRAHVTRRDKGKKPVTPGETRTPDGQRSAMTWARRLKPVFGIDIETCSECGGAVRIIASIEDPAVIHKILAHLEARATGLLPESRAPPSVPTSLLG